MTSTLASEPILGLIESIISHVPEAERPILRDQARSAVVTDEVPGRMLDFAVRSGVPRSSLSDGPIKPIPAVLGADGQISGELMLWIRSGYLIGLERSWFTDDPPTTWPEAHNLDFA